LQSVDVVKLKIADLLNKVSADDLQHCFEWQKICIPFFIEVGGEIEMDL
jgi:hypothetical protein